MIGALTGKIFDASKNPLIIMVGGVGYSVSVPKGTFPIGKTITLFTHTHVREDALELYGFVTREELELFELLLSVSGIGPKTALPIVGQSVQAVTRAVGESDVDFFTTIPRLGRKNAQKIIIELKSKLGSIRDLDLSEESTSATKQALDALLSMGFEKKEAIGALRKLTIQDATIEQKIRKALQYLGK